MKTTPRKIILPLTLLILLVGYSSFLFSQTEWAPIGAEWYYGFQEDDSNKKGYTHYKVEKDTFHLGKDCRLIEATYKIASGYESYFKLYTYLSDDSVFIAKSDDSSFRLIMHLDAEIGDTLQLSDSYHTITDPDLGYVYAILQNITLESLDNVELKKYTLEKIDNVYPGTSFCGVFKEYYDRIGNLGGFFSQDNCEFIQYNMDIQLRCYFDQEISIELEDCDFYGIINQTVELSESRIKVFPNPVESIMNIQITGPMINAFRIMNCMGHAIMEDTSFNNSTQIDLSHLPSGIYQIQFFDTNDHKPISFIKL